MISREEAIQEIKELEGVEECSIRFVIIDKIYDEFETQLKNIENRTCEGCKHFQNKIDDYEIACNFICGFFDMKNQKYCGSWETT